MLFRLEAPDLSGQSEAEMLRHDPICWDISHEYSLTDVLAIVVLLQIDPTVHRYYMTFHFCTVPNQIFNKRRCL